MLRTSNLWKFDLPLNYNRTLRIEILSKRIMTSSSVSKAAVVSQFGESDPAILMRNDWPMPTLDPKKRGQLLLKVLSCSTAAGDIHMLSGRLSFVLRPPNNSLPYVPGKDVCGIVQESSSDRFKPGDTVIASKDFEVNGGMAEYVVVNENKAVMKPHGIDNLQAAACTDSAVTALAAVNAAQIKPSDRVLVLGGAGGVGTFLVQMIKAKGVAHLAATSTQMELMKSLGVDQPIDYRTTDWWSQSLNANETFDVLIDCVGGNHHFEKSRGGTVLKTRNQGGRFIAVIGQVNKPVVRNIFNLFGFVFSMLREPLKSFFTPGSSPRYVTVTSSLNSDTLSKVSGLVAGGKMRVVVDRVFPFSPEGVKGALALQASSHAHGKVFVDMSKQE